MSIMKRITSLSMAAVILTASLTACGSGVESMPEEPEASTEAISALETYEDYRKLSDAYLQKDDVLQAIAVLDEGIEKFSSGNLGMEAHKVDLISQRKVYVLAGTVAVRTKLTECTYDDNGERISRHVAEYDKNGNEIKYVSYGAGEAVSRAWEYQYDEKGNRTEYKYIAYGSLGDIEEFSRETWAYDENGRNIEFVSYGEDGEVERKERNEYDACGNQIKYIRYEGNDKIAEWTESEYDSDGNEIKVRKYNERGNGIITIVKDYDGHGNRIRYASYNDSGDVIQKEESQYGEYGNEVEYVSYYDEKTIKYRTETEYDENGNRVKFVRYNEDGMVSLWNEYEYDKDGNVTRYTSYDSEGGIRYQTKSEYNENGWEICGSDNSEGVVTRTWEYEYDERGGLIKAVYISYDHETGEKDGQMIDEFAYDENGNMTKYIFINDDGSGRDSGRGWERAYDEEGRETAFYFYENEKGIFYQSRTEYGGNGLAVRYTGCDGDDNVLVEKETEYDAFGNVIRENHYDADGNLAQYYENEYDGFGSITRQSGYKGGILRSEKQMEYAYHFIGDIDKETAGDTDNDMTPEIFTRFLNGEETIRYYVDYDSMNEGRIVRKTVSDLVDFAYWKDEPSEYAFIDMTGDGIEELVISCGNSHLSYLYVIQNDYGILKAISAIIGNRGNQLVKYHGRTGVCCSENLAVNINQDIYYFFDEKGKKEIALQDYPDFEEDGTESRSYRMYDNDSFGYRDICRGEYEDITNGMIKRITEPAVCWQKLEEPVYGND